MSKQAPKRRLADNEAMAYAHALKASPRKLNLVAEQIRGKRCGTAVAELRFSRKRIAGEVRKILESAIANAENNHQLDVDRLFVAEATVGRGIVMKRWRARARGRVGKVQKRYSTIRLIVREREETA